MSHHAPTGPIAILGLGYVGLLLASARENFDVVGLDTDPKLIVTLHTGRDPNGEVADSSVSSSKATFTTDAADLVACTTYIIAVPTPITDAQKPDLGPVLSTCATTAPHLNDGDLVILESTVNPGVTKEVCGPALEAGSEIKAGAQIKLGYSPKRVNPGDAEYSIENVTKIIAAQDDETLDRLDAIYGTGVYDAIVMAVGHKQFVDMGSDAVCALEKLNAVLYDIKGICGKTGSNMRL